MAGSSVLLLERILRGAGYVSITSTMDAECGAISGDIGSCSVGPPCPTVMST
jgi:hypothetical protein